MSQAPATVAVINKKHTRGWDASDVSQAPAIVVVVPAAMAVKMTYL